MPCKGKPEHIQLIECNTCTSVHGLFPAKGSTVWLSGKGMRSARLTSAAELATLDSAVLHAAVYGAMMILSKNRAALSTTRRYHIIACFIASYGAMW
jgi:hypothetical protein